MRSALWLACLVALVAAPTAHAAPPPELANVEVDLRWMTSCPGPWGHEERNTIGPVTVRTYECDDGGT